jgi:hypothetical protein
MTVLNALALPRVHWVGGVGRPDRAVARRRDRIVSRAPCCAIPFPHSDRIKRIYALDHANAAETMRVHGVGEWCRRTLGYRLDVDRADAALQDWVIRKWTERQRGRAAMHECFEHVDTVGILASLMLPFCFERRQKPDFSSSNKPSRYVAERTGGNVRRLRPRREPAATGRCAIPPWNFIAA